MKICPFKVFVSSFVAAFALSVFAADPAVVRHVAPDGDDASDGSTAKPFRTVGKAVESLRATGVAAEKEIVLEDGVYPFEKPVSLVPKDGRLTVRAAHPGKVTLLGSVKVTGWAADPEDARFVSAPFPFAAKSETVRTLVVNGECAEIASFPDYASPDGFVVAPGDASSRHLLVYEAKDLPSGRDFRGLDLASVWVSLIQCDATKRTYLATNDWEHARFFLKEPSARPLVAGSAMLKLMNLRLGMRRPGCWMYGNGRIVYWPKPGESAAKLEAYVSRAGGAFDIAPGTRGVTLKGIVMDGFAGTLSGHPFVVSAPGRKTYEIAVEDCEIRNSANGGVHVTQGYDCRVVGCHIHHNGATGVELRNTGRHKLWLDDAGVKDPGGSRGHILGCHIHHNGFLNISRNGQYCAIGDQVHLEGYGLDFAGNRVHDGYGCGVSVAAEKVLFASNEVHHVMKHQRDGAGVRFDGAGDLKFVGNRLHDTVGGPSLMIQGGAGWRIVGNEFACDWQPLRLVNASGLTVTGNVFDYEGPAMRFAFEGTAKAVFTDNLIRAGRPVEDDPYLANLDAWSNDVEVREADGTVRKLGRVTLVRRPPPPKDAVRVPRASGPGIIDGFVNAGYMRNPSKSVAYAIDRDEKGGAVSGGPKATFYAAFDDENLYVAGSCAYAGKPDAAEGVRFRFGGLDLRLGFDGSVVASAGGFTAGPENHVLRTAGSAVQFAFALPLARIGVKGCPTGAELAFDAELCDAQGKVCARFVPPRADGKLAGKMFFVPFVPETSSLVQAAMLRDAQGRRFDGVTSPFGRVQLDAVRDAKDGATALRGFAVRDRSDRARFGHATLLYVPYSDADPADDAEKTLSVEPGTFRPAAGMLGAILQGWDIHSRHVATRSAAFSEFWSWRDETLKILVDTSFAEERCVETSDCEIRPDGTLVLHNRVKDAQGAAYEVWGRMGFDRKPDAVRELKPLAGKVGRRYIFTFSMAASDGRLVVRSAVSEQGAAAAEAAFTADPPADFAKRERTVRRDWDRALDIVRVDGELISRNLLLTMLAGVYELPETAEGTFALAYGGEEAGIKVKIRREGPLSEKTRVKAVRVSGETLSDLNDIAGGCFELGDVVEIELTDKPLADDEKYLSTGMNQVTEASAELGADPDGLRVLFVGNSITLHAPMPPLWTNNCGMAASAPEKDYAHVLVRDLERRFGRKARVKIVNYAHFERGYGSFDFSTVDKLVAFRPEVVVFALGENVGALPDEEARFGWRHAFDRLVGKFMGISGKKPLAVVRGVFWPNAEKDAAMAAVAKKYGIPFARVDFVNEPGMSAKGQGFDANPGIAYHPGDKGMAEIAKRLLSAMFPEMAGKEGK